MILPQRKNDAGWSSPVARWAHNPKVAGSNPVPATKYFNRLSIFPAFGAGSGVTPFYIERLKLNPAPIHD